MTGSRHRGAGEVSPWWSVQRTKDAAVIAINGGVEVIDGASPSLISKRSPTMADIIEHAQRFKQGAEALDLRDTASLSSLSSTLDAISTPLASDVELRYDHLLPSMLLTHAPPPLTEPPSAPTHRSIPPSVNFGATSLMRSSHSGRTKATMKTGKHFPNTASSSVRRRALASALRASREI